jgi:hypothetical protein
MNIEENSCPGELETRTAGGKVVDKKKFVDKNCCCCRTASTRPRRLNPDFLCFSSSVARFYFFLSNVNGVDQMQDEAHGDEARDSSPGPKKQENPQIIQMVTKDPNQVFYK